MRPTVRERCSPSDKAPRPHLGTQSPNGSRRARLSVMSTVFTPTRARLSVAQFHEMAETGIFSPESRLELIDGALIEIAPIGPRHMQVVNRLTRALLAAVGDAAIVSV